MGKDVPAAVAVALYAAVALFVPLSSAQSCSQLRPSSGIRPSLASGYQMQVVATGLSSPRGLALDTAGNLLVVQAGDNAGTITAHSLSEQGNGCVVAGQGTNVTQRLGLNHGIEISDDGRTLYGSSTENAYSWDYDAQARTASNQKTLITGMTTTDHTTRTLLLSRKVPGMLVVSRGSASNIDGDAVNIDSGHSQVRAFDLGKMNGTAYNYSSDGLRLGWGLRNDVGVAEHPTSGGIWSVENSVDQVSRLGIDVHQDNPAEELNFLGYLNGTQVAQQGANFGYPWCYAAWDPSVLPDNTHISLGTQFAIDPSTDLQGQNKTDQYCADQVAPRLSFQAHMAPLDIKFNNSGRDAWISMHGSWNRANPVGYKLVLVEFNDSGEPVEPANSSKAAADILSNTDNSACPDHCFRPAGLVFDKQGRIFMSSDSSGEVYMISRQAATSASSGQSGAGKTSNAPVTTSPWANLCILTVVALGLFHAW